jgi:long-chain acyl-CoA synthetase
MPVTDDRLGTLHPEMTLPEVWNARVLATPDREAYRVFDAASRAWISHTWSGVAALVELWRRAFFAENFAPGARIGVLLPNGIDHVCADQAALALGLVTVPLHVIDNPGNLAYILADCGASALIVDSLERWRALADHRAELPDLRCVVYLKGESAADEGIAKAAAPWWLAGAAVPAAPDGRALDAAALASIVYTSGSTGRPKGVMLSHRNIVTDLAAIERAIRVHGDDVFLSFLPLSHTLERTAGYYLPVAAGAAVAFARSAAHLMEDLRAVRPTVLISVPRIYERAYAGLREAVDAHAVKRWILARAVDVGWRRFEYAQGRAPRPSVVARLVWPLLDRVVGAPLRDRFGGRLRAAVAGGAPLPVLVARPFLALGVPVLQGYGMTESAPVVSCNTLDDNDPASVGRALPGVEVRIGEGGELLVRGGNVMMGYWQRPSDTAAALSSGWLHTGDVAVLEEGRIRISGRIKDIIVTSTGEKVSPADLEAAILDDPMFDQAMVIGEQRPFLAALLVLNPGRWPEAATRLGLDPGDASSSQSKVATQWALERVRQTAKSFPSYAVPRAVVLATDVWTTANGLITPTLKPKRPAIAAHYATQIDRIYAAHSLQGCAPLDDRAGAQGRD